jgi:GT2 family glycosyltransferase
MVDNASTDGSVGYVTERFPWVKVIGLESNHGFSGGNDVGVEHACGKYVAFLNNDVEVEPTWLSELVEGIEEDEKIASCGSKMLFYERRNYVNHAGGAVTITGAGFDIGFMMEEKKVYNKPKFVGCTSGGAMLVRKGVFCTLGGFDPDYFAYFEDVDFCLRAWEFGYKMMYVPSSIAYHKFGGSFGKKASNARIYYCQRNRLANVIKHFEAKTVIMATAISFAYDTYRILFFLRHKKYESANAIIKGSGTFLKGLRTSIKKRSYIQKNRILSDSQIKQLGIVASIRDMINEQRRLEKLSMFES